MKIRILNRILTALAGLLMLAAGAALAAQLFFQKNVAAWAGRLLADESLRVYLIIGCVLLCLLGLFCFVMPFRRAGRGSRFVTQKMDSGELAISLKALETMVQKCLEQHKEVKAQTLSLSSQKGSLLIRIRGTVAGGISIPLTVDTLQQQIKQYVTACSGVEVKEIRVEIDSSGPDAKDAPFAIEAPTAKALLKAADEKNVETAAEKVPEKPADGEKKEAVPEAGAKERETAEVPKNTDAEELSAAAAAAALLMEEVPEEDDDRPIHQRLFSTMEEPCVMPMPPAGLEEQAPAGKDGNAENAEKEQKADEKTAAENGPDVGKAGKADGPADAGNAEQHEGSVETL